MPTPTVVEDLDVLEDRRPRFGACIEVTAMHEFLLERSEEALDHGIVPTIALAAHAARDPQGIEAPAVVDTRVLTAAI